MLPVSKGYRFRVVRRRSTPHLFPPTVIGIDDWRGGATSAMGPSFATWSTVAPAMARRSGGRRTTLRHGAMAVPHDPRYPAAAFGWSRSGRRAAAGWYSTALVP